MDLGVCSIYVDGACRNNGHNNPQGGCGIFWGPLHAMNTAEKLKGDKQTNNRAELSAAIVAVAQSIKLGLSSIEISTDSKHVKEGITKWIKEWKSSDWKTAKKKDDVLNKDLWQLLDYAKDQLNVEWKWVEGHQEIEGNLQADALAKKGIGAESIYWQTFAEGLYAGSCSEDLKRMEEQPPTTIRQKEVFTDPACLCKKCTLECEEEESSIQCQDCRRWLHYRCSDLPPYQLYLYETTQRHFTCEFCVEFEEGHDFHKANSNQCVPSLQLKFQDTFVATEVKSQLTTEKATDTIDLINLNSQPTRSCSQLSSSCQTDTTDTVNTLNDKILDELESFRKTTISQLETSFVKAFDKINDSVTDMKQSKEEEQGLRQQINDLKLENEQLRNRLSKKDEHKGEHRECKKCDELISRLEKLRKDSDKEKESLQRNLYNVRLEKELQESKLRTEVASMRDKLDISSKQQSAQMSDISMMEKRIHTKNDLIITLEEDISKLTKKTNDLQDEILAWKLHDCRNDNTLRTNSNAEVCSVKRMIQEPKEVGTERSDTSRSSTETRKGNSAAESEHLESDNEPRRIQQETEVDKTTRINRQRRILIIGTSNTKYLNKEYIGEKEFEVSKVTKYTLDETLEYFQALETTE